MLTVLPVSGDGVSYGIWVLEALIKRYEDNVVTIIQIGGEEDHENPSSATSFIVLLLNGFNFSAFVSHLGTSPATEEYSGTGSAYYEEFRNLVLKFQGEVVGIPGLFSDNSREVNKYGIQAKCMGFSWHTFFGVVYKDMIDVDIMYQDQDILTKEFFSDKKGMDWLMNVYRIFILNQVCTHLWEIIKK